MSEATERSKLTKWLRRCNALVFPQVPTKYSAFAVPDLLVIHNTWTGFIETKMEGNRLSTAQLDTFTLCMDRNFPVAAVTFLKGGTLHVVLGPNKDRDLMGFYCTKEELLPLLHEHTERT